MKHTRFFKLIRDLSIDILNYSNNNLRFQEFLLGLDTVLPKNVVLKDNEELSNNGKKLIKNKTHCELDYYFEILRIYYVNYELAKEQFEINNMKFKNDCLKFIKDNNIPVSYNNPGPSTRCGGGGGKSSQKTQTNTSSKYSKQPKNDKKHDKKNKPNKSAPTHNSYIKNKEDYTKYAIVPYNYTNNIIKNEKKSSMIWKKLFRLISLYTHPDKTDNSLLQYLFGIVSKKYDEGKHYFLIFILKLLEIDHKLPKKYRNFEKKNKSRYNDYIKELDANAAELWNARMYFIRTPVYKYSDLNEDQKLRLVKTCLTKNIMEFKSYEQYTAVNMNKSV